MRRVRQHPVDDDAGFSDIAQTHAGIAIQAPPGQDADGRRCRGGELRHIDIGAQDVGQSVRNGLAGEQTVAGQHLPQHHAEGPDIGAAVHGLAAGLLGAHVAGRAQNDPGLGRPHGNGGRICLLAGAPGVFLGGLCQAEIQHLDITIGTHFDIGGLQVAMDDAPLVSVLERLRYLAGDPQNFLEREGTGLDPVGERGALDQFHDQRTHTLRLLHAIDCGDVGVVHRSEHMRFAPEARHAVLIFDEIRRQRF